MLVSWVRVAARIYLEKCLDYWLDWDINLNPIHLGIHPNLKSSPTSKHLANHLASWCLNLRQPRCVLVPWQLPFTVQDVPWTTKRCHQKNHKKSQLRLAGQPCPDPCLLLPGRSASKEVLQTQTPQRDLKMLPSYPQRQDGWPCTDGSS